MVLRDFLDAQPFGQAFGNLGTFDAEDHFCPFPKFNQKSELESQKHRVLEQPQAQQCLAFIANKTKELLPSID